MEKLKPCPFCGGKAVIEVKMNCAYITPKHKRGCFIEPNTWLKSDEPIEKQVKAWNKRWKDSDENGIREKV